MFFHMLHAMCVERNCRTAFPHVVFNSHKILFLDAHMLTRSATHSMACDLMLAQEYCFWRDNYELGIKKNRHRRSWQRTELLQLNRITSWGAYQANVSTHMAQTPQNGNLHIFREGIAPEYDDPLNRNGGLFKLTLHATCCAMDAFAALCNAFVLGHLTTHGAVNGVTFSKKGMGWGLKVWVGSRQKQMVAHVQEWFTNEFDGLISSCLFCPIASLLTSIHKRQAALYLPPPQPTQQPQGPNPRDAIGVLNAPPPPPVMMPAAATAGNMGKIPRDSVQRLNVSGSPSLFPPNKASSPTDGRDASGGSLGSTQASTRNANERAGDSQLSSLSKDDCRLQQAVEERVRARLTDVPQMEASTPRVPAPLSVVHHVVSEDAVMRHLMGSSRYSQAWAVEAADAVRKRLQATAERCRAFPQDMEVEVVQTSPQAPCCTCSHDSGESVEYVMWG